MLPDEEMIVREELNRIDTNASPVSSDADSLQQHDSLHGDDDEDRIPDELLLKYTKADSLGQDDFPVEPTASPSAGRSSRSGEQQRAQTPDKLPPEDPEETTAKKKIVLDLRRTKSTENMQTNEKSEVTDELDPKTDLGSQMDLSEKPIEEKEEEEEKKPQEPPETKVCVVVLCTLSCVLILKAFSVVTFKATCKVTIYYCHQTLFNL